MAGIYIHIPFCKTRCIYCDFYSTTQSDIKDRYIDALCRELALRKPYLANEPVETIYFGGGTPSQLDPKDFEKIFETINIFYGIEACVEITLEANPNDLSPDYIAQLKRLPFNRISIGIQTFNDQLLKLLKRRHTSAQAIKAVNDCKSAGFSNISIDLMYGLPGEAKDIWMADLKQAIDLDVPHISAYHLIYEEGTPLYSMLQKYKVKEVDEESSVNFFATMIDQLTQAGFEHYEISNFCRPGMYSRHNSAYWLGNKYLGCGPSAHSYNGADREWNISSLNEYIIGIECSKPIIEREELDLYTCYNDFIITSLRTVWGMPLLTLKDKYGDELYHYCLENAQKHLNSGKLELRDNKLLLTRDGIFLSDGIMSDLLWVEE